MVVRDRERKRIAGREVVRGDILVLSEGDRIPADASLLWSTHLTVDESLLTGESIPVRKRISPGETWIARPGGEDFPFVYSGTLIVQGQGIAQETATGMHTEMGKIGKALQTVQPEETRLQKETRRMVGQLTFVAIAICVAVGVMITGDYPETAQNIAHQIGLGPTTEVFTGNELARMNDQALKGRIKTVNIFARVLPEQKLQIVDALKHSGEIVAMTGDGVNDAPALKSAHIGIAMGKRGTDVAREAADLVLMDDDFSSIVQSVGLGRRILDNLKKEMAYTLAVHVPIAGMSLFPVLFGWPLVLLPIHIAFLHLIIDPACTIVFEVEPAKANVMHRAPCSVLVIH